MTWTQMAKRPVQPLPKVGGCPLGCCSSGAYCVPSKGSNTSGVIRKPDYAANSALLSRCSGRAVQQQMA